MISTTKSECIYRLDSDVRHWLDLDEPEETGAAGGDQFDCWLERKESGEGIVEVGSILVDEKVLTTHFACVPERCSPVRGRRNWRSCCTDVYVTLSSDEKRRLARMREELGRHLSCREPRLECSVDDFYLDKEGDALCQPGGRCVFSEVDGRGRIRCHLHKFAKLHNILRSEIQPYTCRIFPLLLILLNSGRILLTVLNKSNYKAFNTYSPKSFPCLADPSLPPLVESMADTLDWLFTKGFAHELSMLRL
jgi:hypothetical protein